MIEPRRTVEEALVKVTEIVKTFSQEHNIEVVEVAQGLKAIVVTVDQPMANFLERHLRKASLQYGVPVIANVMANQ